MDTAGWLIGLAVVYAWAALAVWTSLMILPACRAGRLAVTVAMVAAVWPLSTVVMLAHLIGLIREERAVEKDLDLPP